MHTDITYAVSKVPLPLTSTPLHAALHFYRPISVDVYSPDHSADRHSRQEEKVHKEERRCNKPVDVPRVVDIPGMSLIPIKTNSCITSTRSLPDTACCKDS